MAWTQKNQHSSPVEEIPWNSSYGRGLSKLFHERMDVNGASDVMRAIQSGLIGLEVTAMGPLGISSKSEKDLLLPNFDNQQVRARLEGRLMNERAVLCCLRCQSIRRFRVARYPEISDAKVCLKCKGQMLACAREGLEKQLIEWVKSMMRKPETE